MNFFKKLFVVLLFLIVVFLVAGLFLPQKQHVERTVNITAPAAQVYQRINNPKSFQEWSPWAELDPDMQLEISGPESGVGASMRWKSDSSSVGSGSWTIIDAVENKSIQTALTFDGQGGATSFFNLEPKGNGTNITWGFDTDAGNNPIMRWFGIMLDQWVGAEYEKGLKNLKAQLEQG